MDAGMTNGSSMTEVTVASLGLDKSSNTPVVILRESGGERLLPIWIGPGEASAIAMQLAGIKFSRPLTHDLFGTRHLHENTLDAHLSGGVEVRPAHGRR